MCEYTIRNSFIGLIEDFDNFYIESIDLNNILKKTLLNEFLFQKDNNNNLSKNINYLGFCFDCKKNINNSHKFKHSIIYYNDIIKNIDTIQQMELKINIAKDSFNYIIDIINIKLNNFIKRNHEQLLLIEKIINCYKSALNSNNLTYQILFNIQNILKINNIDFCLTLENYPIDLNFNFLNISSIDNITENNYIFHKIQKNSEIIYKEKINSILVINEKNKIIINSDNEISLLNLKYF